MATKERNRGKHPNDDKLFAPKWHPVFKAAVDDLSFLLTRGYGEKAALQLVGNRYKLNSRQRKALWRMSVAQENIVERNKKRLGSIELASQNIEIDGFNLLILLETALSGGYVFKSRDGVFRDISSVHGSYKRVVRTEEAITMVGEFLQKCQVASIRWLLDKPVSNSGRLKTFLLEIAQVNGFCWTVDLFNNPDRILAKSKCIVISCDGWILNRASRWVDLGGYLIENRITQANIMDV